MVNHYKHFGHLHVPDSWEQYWSKYPNGYSMMEALINWVGQVNDMVDSVNENNEHITCLQRNFNALDKELRASWKGYKDSTEKTYKDFRDEVYTIINNWIATIEPTIQDEVVKSLSAWLKDGTLADIINKDVFDMKANQTDLDEVTAQLAEKANEASGGLLNDIWKPPLQQNANQYVGQNVNDPNVYYEKMWDMLLEKHPSYIAKTQVGTSTIGTFPIYKYVFEPEQYEKTVIITGFTHGDEVIANKTLFNFIVSVADKHDSHPALTYMRSKVRMVIVPILNPSGVSNLQRKTLNDVDINRNFPYGWNDFNQTEATKKGTAPLSENESQIVDALFKEYSDAVAYIDTHNTPSIPAIDYYADISRNTYNSTNLLIKIARQTAPSFDENKLRFNQSIEPTIVNHAAHNYNLHAVNVEWVPGSFGNTSQERADMTEALKWMGNVIIQYAKLEKMTSCKIDEVKAVNLFMASTTPIANTGYDILTKFNLDVTTNTKGFVLLTGNAIVSADTATIVNVAPIAYQAGVGTLTLATQRGNAEVYASLPQDTNARTIIPFQSLIPVYPKSESHGVVQLRLDVKTGSGTVTFLRTRLSAVFIPANDNMLRYIDDANGDLKVSYPVPVS